MFPRSPIDSLDVAVLSGGTSSQRDTSVLSGRAVAAALAAAGHNVARFDPADVELTALNWHQFDACFLALQGGEGEDGRVQTTLRELGIPFTGSGPEASLLAMSKLAGKERLRSCGVPTPEAVALWANEPLLDVVRRLRSLTFPVVVKPDGQGNSMGVGIARWADELTQCIAAAGRFESLLLAERFVMGRELTVTIFGRDVLGVLEIEHQRRLFDFDAKFHSVDTRIRRADDRDSATAEARSVALEAAAALGTRGLVRVDLIVDGEGEPWVLELNTLPDLTERSLAPQAAALAGLDMPRLCDQMVQDCLRPSEVLA